MKGYLAADCNRRKKCFNCQGFNHIAANCHERKRNAPLMRRRRGKNFQGGYRGRNARQHCRRGESTLNTREEAVLRVSEIPKKKNKLYEVREMDENNMHVCESDSYRIWLIQGLRVT